MKKVGIIGAMELEVSSLKNNMTIERKITKAGMEFCEGILKGTKVVVVRSGVGKVNAGICTQILSDIFGISHVINTGVGGSLNSSLDVGDIIISNDAIQHDMDAVDFGYPKGEIPQMGVKEFIANPKLADLAFNTAKELFPEIKIIKGRILTGDRFISSIAAKKVLDEEFNGDCCEMEGAAIAHAAYLNNIPFVIIRAVSDNADKPADTDYYTFERVYAQRSAKLVEELVGLI